MLEEGSIGVKFMTTPKLASTESQKCKLERSFLFDSAAERGICTFM
uniref:Uncharacterized protein n=1 Tax=Rhizophora mucronata TaxID=61149 RepID=A0A2P2PHD9_RHIMU